MIKNRDLTLAFAAITLLNCAPAAAQQPDLESTSIVARDGHVLRLADYRGKWLLINYWATWCGACIEEFPALNTLSADPTLRIIGLSDEAISKQNWDRFLAAHRRPYPVALVDRAALPALLSPRAYFLEPRPISYLVRPDGTVARRFLGRVTAETIKASIETPDR